MSNEIVSKNNGIKMVRDGLARDEGTTHDNNGNTMVILTVFASSDRAGNTAHYLDNDRT